MTSLLFRTRPGKKRLVAYVPGLLAIGTWWYRMGHEHRWLKTPAGHWGAEYHGCDICGKTTHDDVETFVPRSWSPFKDKTLDELDDIMKRTQGSVAQR